MYPKQPATSNQQLAAGDQQLAEGDRLAAGDQRLAEGIRLFNEERFFEAHEAWEELWLRTEGEERMFLQGLIQLAAACHHLQRGTVRGAGRLLDAAVAKLSLFPPHYRGVDRAGAIAFASRDRSRPGDGDRDGKNFPKIRYN